MSGWLMLMLLGIMAAAVLACVDWRERRHERDDEAWLPESRRRWRDDA